MLEGYTATPKVRCDVIKKNIPMYQIMPIKRVGSGQMPTESILKKQNETENRCI